MIDHLDPEKHPWMRDEGLRRLLDTIKAGGGEARPVGGCVRDALLGLPVGEIDLAVNLPPKKVSTLLGQAGGIKVVPTGIDHGTVTAVVDHKGYEITTLRRDVETDGRHATVAFTDDWQADAARRDFTFNAIYVDADGKIYDFFDGRADLEARRVRFIGDAGQRIEEDVLRILRFFRFYAWVGRGEPDQNAVAACHALAHFIPQLSVERVWRETSKLLSAPNPLPAWKLMKGYGVLDYFLPEASNLKRLEAALAAETKYEVPPAPLLRLAALLPKDAAIADQVVKQLKLSNAEADKLKMIIDLPDRLKGNLEPKTFRTMLYKYGAAPAREGLILLKADEPKADPKAAFAEAAQWKNPVFPLQGNDMLRLDVMQGPQVGAMLKAVEEWWIAQDFKPDKAECIAEAKRQLKRSDAS